MQSDDLVPAAVLIPLLIKGDPSLGSVILKTRESVVTVPLSTEILFTVRTDKVEHHKGQISFPGGVFEPGDESLEITALRETEEEVGIARGEIEVVAEMPTIPTVATKFKVTPYVGLIRNPQQFKPNPDEIDTILLVPLTHLLNPHHSVLEHYERNGVRIQMKAYHFKNHRIWGATGRMLQTLLEKLVLS